MNLVRWHKRLAWTWLLLVVAAVAYNAKIWIVDHRSLETDFLALLPSEENDPIVRHAFEHIAAASQQDVLVLVGAPDWTQARNAADAYNAEIARHADAFVPMSLAAMQSDAALTAWWSNRASLLAPEDRVAIQTQTARQLAQRAMQELMSPISTGRIGAWQDDPFGTFRRWLRMRAADTPVRPIDGVLRVDDGEMHYVAIPMRLRTQAFAMKTQRVVSPVFDSARAAAMRVSSDIRVLSAGMVFPAAAAAAQANREFNTIGWGSLIGIIVIMWITFRSLRPIGLVLLSLVVGTIGAVAVTALFFPQMHLLTLVFGASLIGVAEDYGMHVLCVSDRQIRGPLNVIRESLPGLALALFTTAISFVGLGVSPFPGLRQIALFSAVGLISAWVTVILWFPILDGPQVGSARVVAWFDALRVRWQNLLGGRARYALGIATVVLCAVGLARLTPNDDIRLLQSLPDGMVQEQTNVGRILNVPFTAQFYLVRGASEEEVLLNEEALRARLDSLAQQNILTGYQAVSTWVPSSRVQQRDRAVIAERLYGPGGSLDQLRVALGENVAWSEHVRTTAAPRSRVALDINSWLASPVSEPMRPLWIGQRGNVWTSVVTLKGVKDLQAPELARAAAGLDGVTWADQISGISSVLGRYRARMSIVLAISYVVVWIFFLFRYGRRAWRVLAPSVLASVAALAVIGLLGQPLQLFHILGLYLVFGLGVDYAIFLAEHSKGQGEDVWFAVGLAATSTVLSLGLLALSATPVLRAFGLTMLIGITVSLITAPLFCARRASSS